MQPVSLEGRQREAADTQTRGDVATEAEMGGAARSHGCRWPLKLADRAGPPRTLKGGACPRLVFAQGDPFGHLAPRRGENKCVLY